MAHVITSSCAACLDGACAEVCPVDAIHGAAPIAELRTARRREQLYIDPESCICCAACEPECPVGAIYEDEALPRDLQHEAERNRAFFRDAGTRSR
jgi:NAD-dependent dihydropyrimidine dehydrogenase PreA subunit